MSRVTCTICPHHCEIEPNQTGLCRARGNRGGRIEAINYALITSIALDPIEKKPLKRFCPGSRILSVGSFGCNLRCRFCQNHEISMCDMEHAAVRRIFPDALADMAVDLKQDGNIGIAYTYNEPLVGYEYVYDCCVEAHKRGLKNVVVTNGYICGVPLKKLLPHTDAFNIDLKAFSDAFYRSIGGDLDTVKQTIILASQSCHVEVTTLIIPDENDGEAEMRSLSEWLASVDRRIPLHITRFFPMYKLLNKPMTDVDTLHKLAQIAKESLEHVYVGNC